METQTDRPASGASPVPANPQKRWSIDFVRDIFFGLGNLHIPIADRLVRALFDSFSFGHYLPVLD